ncbi:uncharacterized protein TNCV_3160671 [Trichonephila clavipes]|nr:uncharacterized protein TNCV_3160671 [Trichonephila clavipes]
MSASRTDVASSIKVGDLFTLEPLSFDANAANDYIEKCTTCVDSEDLCDNNCRTVFFINYSIFRLMQVSWEATTSRFLLYEIPTNVSLEELSAELQDSNNFEIVEIRRFIKLGTNPEISPVLITILGTVLPDNVKLWFINHKIQLFIDKPRQCTKCFSFSHPSRFGQSLAICCNCGSHSGECTVNANCINCKGNHIRQIFLSVLRS